MKPLESGKVMDADMERISKMYFFKGKNSTMKSCMYIIILLLKWYLYSIFACKNAITCIQKILRET